METNCRKLVSACVQLGKASRAGKGGQRAYPGLDGIRTSSREASFSVGVLGEGLRRRGDRSLTRASLLQRERCGERAACARVCPGPGDRCAPPLSLCPLLFDVLRPPRHPSRVFAGAPAGVSGPVPGAGACGPSVQPAARVTPLQSLENQNDRGQSPPC